MFNLDVKTNFKHFQLEVRAWIKECFGKPPIDNINHRGMRFFEEAVELCEAADMTLLELQGKLQEVYDRRNPGHRPQEVGGVMVTLAGFTDAMKLDLDQCANMELERIWKKMPEIRLKNKRKLAEDAARPR